MNKYYIIAIACFCALPLNNALSICYQSNYHKSDVININPETSCGTGAYGPGTCLPATRTVTKQPQIGYDKVDSGKSGLINTMVKVTQTIEKQECKKQNDGTCAWETISSDSVEVPSFGQLATGEPCPCQNQ